jgi:hypothetical protein
VGKPNKGMKRNLLWCGVIAPAYFIFINDVIAVMLYPGYDRITRPVSELSATYAPSRPLLLPLLIIFQLLMMGFWIGVWQVSNHNRYLRISGIVMVVFTVLGILAYPFPMTTNEVWGANTIHSIIWGIVAPILMFFGIGVSAFAFGKRFQVFAALIVCALVIFSILTGVEAARVISGETHTWFGIVERALIGTWLTWVFVLAITLLRIKKEDVSS